MLMQIAPPELQVFDRRRCEADIRYRTEFDLELMAELHERLRLLLSIPEAAHV